MYNILKTSYEWYKLIPSEFKFQIYDADGWDRTNFYHSFHQELITKEEFKKRVMKSTCISTKDFNIINF